MLRQRSFWPYSLIGVGVLMLHGLALTLWSQYGATAKLALVSATLIMVAALTLIIGYSKFGAGGILRLIAVMFVRGKTDLDLHLLSIEGDYTPLLDAGAMPPTLREQLHNAGLSLSSSASVEQLEPGEAWTIADRATRTIYTVQSAGHKLRISVADERANESIFHLALLCQVAAFIGVALIMALPFAPAPSATSQSSQPGAGSTATIMAPAVVSPTLDSATAPITATLVVVLDPPVLPTPVPNWRRLLDNHLFLFDPPYDQPAAASTRVGSTPLAVAGADGELDRLVLVERTAAFTEAMGDQTAAPGILILNFGPATDLTGWHLRLEDQYDYVFGPSTLGVGEALGLYWGAEDAASASEDGLPAIYLAWENVAAALPAQLTLATPEDVVADQLEIGYPAP